MDVPGELKLVQEMVLFVIKVFVCLKFFDSMLLKNLLDILFAVVCIVRSLNYILFCNFDFTFLFLFVVFQPLGVAPLSLLFRI